MLRTLSALFLAMLPALAQRPDTNYDEARIKPYKLPDLLGPSVHGAIASAQAAPIVSAIALLVSYPCRAKS